MGSSFSLQIYQEAVCGKNCNSLLENTGAGDRNSVSTVEIDIGIVNRLTKSAS
jgi:hypothetical protein